MAQGEPHSGEMKQNEYFTVHDDFVHMNKYGHALDGASAEELKEFRECLDEAIEWVGDTSDGEP